MRRVLTAGIGIPLVLALVAWSPAWLFALVVAAIAAAALSEFFGLLAAQDRASPGRWFIPLGALVTGSFLWGPEAVLGLLTVVGLLLLGTLIGSRPVQSGLDRFAAGAAGLIYTCLLPGFLIWLSRPGVVVLLGVVWAGDIAAYYGGRAFGRRRLAPVISPNKTVAGAVFGAAASVAAGVVIGHYLLDSPGVWLAAVSLAAGTAAQLGDLAESVMKRSAGVKDSARLLPGHGGMLDRIDSLLFAAPVLYWLLEV